MGILAMSEADEDPATKYGWAMDVVTDQAVIAGYLTDASNTTGWAEGLVRPGSTDEVAAVLAHCQTNGIPVTVTARRTSTTAGPVPYGGWLLSTERLDTVYARDEVDGGVILGAHQVEIERERWLFPPDPTSRHECSVGAAIACNASGARTFRYGPTRPWVQEIEVVLPSGEVHTATRDTPIPADWPAIHWEPPAVKTAAGFFPADNLLDLMIGQEGVLGVITRARLRLVPMPAGVLSLVAFFPDLATTLAFVDRARAGAQRPDRPAIGGALNPRAIEFFDHQSLEMVREQVPDIPQDARCALFIEVEHDGEAPLEDWWGALVEGGALAEATIVAEDREGLAKLQAVRHAIPAGVNERLVANRMPKVGTDFAVPDAALGEMMDLYAAVEMPNVLFGHIGDNHLHLNLLPRDAGELETAKALYRTLAMHAVRLGGTVSAEHGIGKIKRALLGDMVGPDTLGRFQALKAHLDPAHVLGRGTMLAPPE
jgi:D-lactate dehydrogenase (cytochrome)